MGGLSILIHIPAVAVRVLRVALLPYLISPETAVLVLFQLLRAHTTVAVAVAVFLFITILLAVAVAEPVVVVTVLRQIFTAVAVTVV
jgi:hypothetical protein